MSGGAVAVRAFDAAEWAVYRDLRLGSLADAPDAFGSTLAEERLRGDQAWAARLEAGVRSERDLPLLAQLDGAPVGLLWAKVDGDDPSLVNLFQMWVAPQARGRGIAARLLHTAIAWAGDRSVQLGVTLGDTAATRLYAREGFVAVGPPEPLRPGAALMSQTMRR